MHTSFCGTCGAPDPGRFCGACGAPTAPQVSGDDRGDGGGHGAVQSPADATLIGGTPVADEPESADATETWISPSGVGDWQALPPLVAARENDASTRYAGSAPALPPGPGVDAGRFDSAGYGTGGLTPVVIQQPAPPARSQAPVVAALCASMVLLGAGVWWVSGRQDDSTAVAANASTTAPTVTATVTATAQPSVPQGAPPQGVSSAAPTFVATGPQPPARSERDAVATPGESRSGEDVDSGDDANSVAAGQLEAIYAHDVADYDRSSHYIVQLAGKYDGLVDPDQRTPDGEATWRTSDILEQHQILAARYPNVRLLKGQDVNSRVARRDLWVTVYDPGTFSSKSDGQRWCDAERGRVPSDCYASKTK